jgi:hypothetical protein
VRDPSDAPVSQGESLILFCISDELERDSEMLLEEEEGLELRPNPKQPVQSGGDVTEGKGACGNLLRDWGPPLVKGISYFVL